MTIKGSLSRPMRLGLLISALTLAGAAPASAQAAPGKEPAHEKNAVKLVVENHNFLGMHVYAMRDGYVRSLGFVEGVSRGEFTLPEILTVPAGDLRLLADPIGSRVGYLSDPVILGTSKEVDLTVESHLDLSHVTLK